MPKETEGQNAIRLLEQDHKKVKELFKRFEEAEEEEDTETVKEIVAQAIQELKAHTTIEEEIFYPAVAEALDEDEQDILHEAHEEHHVAKAIIAELEQMSGEEENYCAKFMVLAENVRHHVKEEEGEMFPQLKKADLDLEELGQKMAARKQEMGLGGEEEEEEAEMAGARSSRGSKRGKKRS